LKMQNYDLEEKNRVKSKIIFILIMIIIILVLAMLLPWILRLLQKVKAITP
jgi:flagellar basal body-associated protein FliL